MNKFIVKIIIFIIKIYKYLISPLLGSRCRYLPTCSEYLMDCLKMYGLWKGLLFGLRRVTKCHPYKFLGGGSGLDLVPKKKEIKNG
jgi:putative membrane protein insertion efficiency factor|tara:strand:- start:117 stop:374 length:258 start_codon:yes stop_codon:yes gene_type:complete